MATPLTSTRYDKALLGGLSLSIIVVGLSFTITTFNSIFVKTVTFYWITLVLFFLLLIKWLRAGHLTVGRSRLHAPVIMFTLLCAVSAVLMPYRYAGAQETARTVAHTLLYFVVVATITDVRRLNRVLGVLVGVTAVACLYAVFQHFGLDFVPWRSQKRVISTFGNPDFFAGYLVLTIPFLISQVLTAKRKPLLPVASLLLLASLFCLVWTQTRGAWLGAAVALVFLAGCVAVWFRGSLTRRCVGRHAVVIICLLSAVVLAAASPMARQRVKQAFEPQEGTGKVRLVIWRGAIAMAKEKPIFGWGAGRFGIFFPTFRDPDYLKAGLQVITAHAHSEYLEILAEMGIMGLVVFFWLVFEIFRSGLRTIRSGRETSFRYTVAGLLAGCLGLLAHNGLSVNMRWTANGFFFWLMVGLIAASERLDPEENTQHDGKRGETHSVLFLQLNLTPFATKPVVFAIHALAIVAIVAATVFLSRMFFSEVHLRQGHSHTLSESWEDAGREFKRAGELNPYSASALYKLAHCYNMLGEYHKALASYRTVYRLSPDYADLHFNFGCVLRNLRRYSEALREFKKAAAQTNTAENHYYVGEVYRDLHQYDEAIPCYETALRLDPKHERAVFGIGEAYRSQARWDEALLVFEKAVQDFPVNKAVHFRLGWIYGKQGKFDEAIAEYQTVIRLDPDDSQAYNNLGVVYFDLQDFDRAADTFQQAVRRNAKDLLGHFNLGRVYRELGRVGEAVAQFKTVIELGPQTHIAEEAKLTISEMLNK